MTRLLWDASGTRKYETGVDRGVLYPRSGVGVPWNGLTSVQESPTGGDVSSYYLDGVKYLDIVAAEDFKATISAFTAPSEFDVCDGNVSLAPGLIATQQPRQRFGLSYRTLVGNDTEATDHGYKLHLVYNAVASPSQRNNKTLADAPEATALSWDVNSVPPLGTGYRPTAHFVIDSTAADPTNLATLEDLLYGTSTDDPQLPDQDAVIAILGA